MTNTIDFKILGNKELHQLLFFIIITKIEKKKVFSFCLKFRGEMLGLNANR